MRAKWILGSDGSKVFEGFYDSKLSADCTVATAADGRLRCLPGERRSTDTNTFADAACTIPGVLAPDCSTAPFVSTSPAPFETCSQARWDVRRLGERITAPHQKCSGACTDAPGNFAAIAVSEPIPPDQFVAFDEQWQSLGGGLDALVMIAADGARKRVDHRFFDRVREFECSFRLTTDGQIHCVPLAISVGRQTPPPTRSDFFDNATCTGAPLALASPSFDDVCAIEHPKYAERLEGDLCLDRTIRGIKQRVFELAGTVAPTNLHAKESDSDKCTPASAGDRTFYALGDEVDPSTLKEASDGFTGGTRIRYPADVIDGVPVATTDILFDAKTGQSCSYSNAIDGSLRCLPDITTAVLDAIGFSDAACTKPIAIATGSVRCAPRPAKFALQYEGSFCTRRARVFALKGPVGTIYHKEASACVAGPYPVYIGSSFHAFYEVGDEVSPDDWVSGTRTTD